MTARSHIKEWGKGPSRKSTESEREDKTRLTGKCLEGGTLLVVIVWCLQQMLPLRSVFSHSTQVTINMVLQVQSVVKHTFLKDLAMHAFEIGLAPFCWLLTKISGISWALLDLVAQKLCKHCKTVVAMHQITHFIHALLAFDKQTWYDLAQQASTEMLHHYISVCTYAMQHKCSADIRISSRLILRP